MTIINEGILPFNHITFKCQVCSCEYRACKGEYKVIDLENRIFEARCPYCLQNVETTITEKEGEYLAKISSLETKNDQLRRELYFIKKKF